MYDITILMNVHETKAIVVDVMKVSTNFVICVPTKSA